MRALKRTSTLTSHRSVPTARRRSFHEQIYTVLVGIAVTRNEDPGLVERLPPAQFNKP